MENKEVIVLIPIYKNYLDAYEMTSLDYCKQYLKNYTILIISPESLFLDKVFIDFINKEKLNVHYFSNKFFDGINGYNNLMLNMTFYKTFIDYKYMLIYQLDVLVFSDKLLEWTKKDYDYIGAPWLISENITSFDSSGNGGLSLRKIKTFISVLESKDLFFNEFKYYETSYRADIQYMIIIRIFRKLKLSSLKLFLFLYKGNEDYFWAFYAKFFIEEYKVASIGESLKFCFEENPSFCFNSNKKELPFGAHAWKRYDLNFWLDHVNGLDNILSQNKR